MSKRILVSVFTLALLAGTAAVASAQDPPPPPPPPPPAAQQPATPEQPTEPDRLLFTSPAAAVLNAVKPEKAADFESVWTEIRTALMASPKPEFQEQAASLKMFKLAVDIPAGENQIYLFYIDPVPTVTFDPIKILFDSGLFERQKADELYAKIKDAYAQIQPWPLQPMGK